MTHGWRFLPVRVGLATRHLEEHRVATVFVEHPIRGLAQRLADAEGVGGGAGGKGASGPRSRARARALCLAEGNQAQLCVGRGKHAQAQHDLLQGALLRVGGLHDDECARAMAHSRGRTARAPRALRCARPRFRGLGKETGSLVFVARQNPERRRRVRQTRLARGERASFSRLRFHHNNSHAPRPQNGTNLHAAGASSSSSLIKYACHTENSAMSTTNASETRSEDIKPPR